MKGRRTDHFSACAGAYSRYRPAYPAELFDWLTAQVGSAARAWDCGCGSGQAAVPLAERGLQVVASDISRDQVLAAPAHPRVHYLLQAAEASALAASTMELVVCAQALHWFDQPAFFAEVERVLGPGGALAVFTYGAPRVDETPIDTAIEHFYSAVLGPWWPPERRQVERGYAGIALPWPGLPAPALAMSACWDLPALLGYLSSWSAVQRYRAGRGEDPLAPLAEQLAGLWPEARWRRIRWPLTLRLCRKPASSPRRRLG